MNELVKAAIKVAYDFKIDKKYWDRHSLTGEECTFERSKPAAYIKKTSEIAKLLGLKTVVEIGATRLALSKPCLEYYEEQCLIDPVKSPACCSDGHGGVLFSLEGFEVYCVDIDDICNTHIEWSFNNIGQSFPNNLHPYIPVDGISFLNAFDKKIDVLFLDGWDVGSDQYREKHVEAYLAAKDKLSDTHLILIDDTDFSLPTGKDAYLSPLLIEEGYRMLFNGRQTLYINQ